MQAGRPVLCRVHHAAGSTEELALQHTYSAGQLDWFRAGSALNCIAPAAH